MSIRHFFRIQLVASSRLSLSDKLARYVTSLSRWEITSGSVLGIRLAFIGSVLGCWRTLALLDAKGLIFFIVEGAALGKSIIGTRSFDDLRLSGIIGSSLINELISFSKLPSCLKLGSIK